MITYRPASLDDAELASDLATAAYPDLPADPIVTRWRWETRQRGYEYGRFIVERDGRPIAFLGWTHAPWSDVPDRSSELEVRMDRAVASVDLLVNALGWLGESATGAGAGLLVTYAADDEAELREALARSGYTAERIEKAWELDLVEHGPRLIVEAEAAAAAMAGAGIVCTTLALWDDPERLAKLHRLFAATEQDIPHSRTIPPESLEDFAHRLRSPDRPNDRFWIALDGGRPVALSYLRFPPVRGMVWTSYTATDPAYRGRGIAAAIKLQSLAQAARLGVRVVGTDNDSANTAMLRINERLGYHRRPGFIEHHKRVTNTGHA